MSILQSRAWEDLQRDLGRSVRRAPPQGTLFVTMPLPLHLQYEYAPHGPIGNTLNGEILHKLVSPPHRRETIFLRIEPRVPDTPEMRGVLMHAGFQKAHDVQPRETLLIDLTKSEEALLKDMEHDTRYAIRAAEKRGVVVTVLEGEERRRAFAKFWGLFEDTNARHGLHAYDKRYYERVAVLNGDAHSELLIAEREGETLAAAIVAYHHTTAYYFYAASRAGHGKYNAPSLLLWTMIRRAQTLGYRTLDLWGISETKREWRGVTAFKKSFGGTSVKFVGTWDYAYRPLWYSVYRLAAAVVRRK